MHMRTALLAVLAAALLPAAPLAAAKCDPLDFGVSGSVVDADGKPVPGARVRFFWDNQQRPALELMPDRNEEIEATESGEYSTSLGFYYDSGRPWWVKRCDRKPKVIKVEVSAEGFKMLRRKFKLKQVQRDPDIPAIKLPVLTMERAR